MKWKKEIGNDNRTMWSWAFLLALAVLTPACDDDSAGAVVCGGAVCEDGLVCDEVHTQCVRPSQLEVCAGKSDGSACEVDGEAGFVCDSEVCVRSICGDGITDHNTGEECDDGTGNSDEPDADCRTDCRVRRCGDGIVDAGAGEECDGTELPVSSCADLGEGYTGGSLTCLESCIFDYSACEGGVCGNGRLEAGEQCDDDNDTDWDGCTGCAITEFQVNTFTIEEQRIPKVAMAEDGRFVVVWHSDGQYGAGALSVYGRLYGPDGTPDGTEFRVNTYTAGNQMYPDAAMAEDGRFVVVWMSDSQDGDGSSGIYAQLYEADGTPRGSEFRVNTWTDDWQYAPSVAMAPDGRFVVVWMSDSQDGDGAGIYGQVFSADGIPDGTEFQVNTHTAGRQVYPSVAMAPDGRFVVVWASWGQDPDGSCGVYGQVFSADGIPDGTEFQVNTTVSGDQRDPRVAMASDGRFVVVWASWGQDPDGSCGVYGQRFDSDGIRMGGEFQVNTYTNDDQMWPSVAMADDGRFVVVWESDNQEANHYASIYMQRYDASGVRASPETRVNVYIDYGQEYPSVAMADDGRFVVAWESWWQDGDKLGIFAQRYTADGTPLGVQPWQ